MVGGKKIATNTLVLILSSLFNFCVSIFTTSTIAKSIGPELYGRYTFGLTYILLFSVLSNFGVESLFIRESARDNKNIKLMTDILYLKILLAIGTIVVIIFSVHILNYQQATINVIYVLCIGLFFQILYESLISIYRSLERMHILAFLSVVFRTISAVIIVSSVYIGIGFWGIVSAFSVTNALVVGLILVLINKEFHILHFNINPRKWVTIIKQGFPFYASAILTMIYVKINILILSKMVEEREMGFYMAALALVENLFVIPTAFNTSIFPAYSRMFGSSVDALKKTYRKITKYLIILTVAVSIGTILVGGRIIQLIYGENFISSIPVLKILIFFWVLTFFSQTQSMLLFSIQKETIQVKIMGLACLISIVLNPLLIMRYGFIGAAYSSVITEAIIVTIITIILWKLNLRYKPDYHILRLGLVVLVMIIAVRMLMQINIFIAITMGAISYFGLLFVMRVFDSEDIFYLKLLFKRQIPTE